MQDQTWIENRMLQYVIDQKQVFMLNLRNQFAGFSPDTVELAINSLIDTNRMITKHDEFGREFAYPGPAR